MILIIQINTTQNNFYFIFDNKITFTFKIKNIEYQHYFLPSSIN
jgi:hypothetical protein